MTVSRPRKEDRSCQQAPYLILLSLLQNSLQLAEMRQGTTSVVPKMAHPDSGFSRCGIAHTENNETQGLKPNIFLLN